MSAKQRQEPRTDQQPANSESTAAGIRFGSDIKTDTSKKTPRGARTKYTPRFAGFIVLLGLFVAAGLVTFQPAAIAGAGLLLAFLLAGLLQTPDPPGETLRAQYDVRPEQPRPGETVTVEVTVENESDETVTDLRVVDSVPDDLQVIDGSPRGGAVLRPGSETTIEYEVLARRGEYEFGPPVARTRTTIGSMWAQQAVPSDDQPAVSCAVRADDLPLDEQATHFLGELLSNTGGDGVEFYATREYHRGDPPSRINWRGLAKRGELSTITHRERKAADVTVVTDARKQARVSAGPGEPSGAMLGAYATYQLVGALIDGGHVTGVAVPGVSTATERTRTNRFPCRRIDHGRGDEQRRQVYGLLETIENLNPPTNREWNREERTEIRRGSDPDEWFGGTTVGEFERQLTGWANSHTQFVVVSPLLDDAIQGLCRRLRARDVPVVVISPDVTTSAVETQTGERGDRSPPTRLLGVQRAVRIEALRQHGCTVIDWTPTEPLSVCCERQTRPGS